MLVYAAAAYYWTALACQAFSAPTPCSMAFQPCRVPGNDGFLLQAAQAGEVSRARHSGLLLTQVY